ncbi:homoserine dehydrogenase [Staphylococcus aureus]|uniref:Homoserine dehydrogenase n=1 Tax=Staphylococcus aureus TaxID=1280 RepID=A0A380DYD2_STAAU|nr:homoserine dehydrogenase [Staphylococcus aureus]
MKKLNIALLGLGTVGSGVVKIIEEKPTANSRYIK